MRTTRQPARPVTIVLRCGTPAWPNDTRIIGEGRTLSAALRDARRALESYRPAPGDVFAWIPVGNGFDRRSTPLVIA